MKSTPRPQLVVRVPERFEMEFPEASALATETFLNIGILAGTVQTVVDRLVAREGLPSAAAFNVLSVLGGDPAPLRPSVIARRMMVSRATITGLLDTLERRDLIRRATGRNDGRAREVSLTSQGAQVVDRLVPDMHRFEHELMGVLPDSQLRQLGRMVALLQAKIAEIEPGVRFGIR